MSSEASPSSPCTCFRVRKLNRLLSQRYDRHLAAAGLNVNQYSILRRLGDRARTIGDLARELGMDRTTLSRDLKPMAAAGWIEAVRGEDARQRPVRVTATGRRVVGKAVPLWHEAQQHLDALLGDGRTARLHAQLDFALARLREVV